jgi:hypothetical protein
VGAGRVSGRRRRPFSAQGKVRLVPPSGLPDTFCTGPPNSFTRLSGRSMAGGKSRLKGGSAMPGRSARLLAAVAAFPFLPFGSLSSLAQDGTLGNQGADAKRRACRRERRSAERTAVHGRRILGSLRQSFDRLDLRSLRTPATNAWSTRASMPTPRESTAVSVVNNVLCIPTITIGGVTNAIE